jgi:hypothetical protein
LLTASGWGMVSLGGVDMYFATAITYRV